MTKISHADYCSKVCGAKCCYKQDKELLVRCPQLAWGTNLCNCYKERFDEKMSDLVYVGSVQINKNRKVDFICGRIQNLIKEKQLRPEVEANCCYAHPELLEKDYEERDCSKLDAPSVA